MDGDRSLEEIVDDAAGRAESSGELEDRFRGVLLGLGVGNGLGLPVEGGSQQSIRRAYPRGVTEIDPEESRRPWDDDLAQAVILAEVLCETPEMDPSAFAGRLINWAAENGRGMGILTSSVIAEMKQGNDAFEAARLAWERNPMSGAGNGAVMRCAPVALRHLFSGSALIQAARSSALVTHYDARCEWSTVVTAALIATCLGGSPAAPGDLAAAVVSAGGKGWPADAIELVSEEILAVEGYEDLGELELDDPMDMGYTLKTMQVAVWCSRRDASFEQTLVDIVAAGGDTDTNGAVAGAVMGAREGASRIPARWAGNLGGAARLEELSDRLLSLARTAG